VGEVVGKGVGRGEEGGLEEGVVKVRNVGCSAVGLMKGKEGEKCE